MDTAAYKLLDLVRSRGLVRPSELAPLGIPRVALTRAVRRGQLERVGRGLYGGCPIARCRPMDRLPQWLGASPGG